MQPLYIHLDYLNTCLIKLLQQKHFGTDTLKKVMQVF